jgi:hypothetical protein
MMMMMTTSGPALRKTARVVALAAVMSLTAVPLTAQETVSDILRFLVTNQSIATGSVERDREAAEATSATISRALLATLATLPVSTSSGGFAYRLNPELGTVERASDSFGPFFVERAMTAGRGTASLGLTIQHMRLTSLDGRSLRDGTLVTTANQFTDEDAPFDSDRLMMNIDADVVTLYGNLGVSDEVEIGVAAPLMALRIEGSRLNTYRGQVFTQAHASATAIGLTDLVVRGKLTLFDQEGAGLAGSADVRLPTGREEDLLGTGKTSLKVAVIGSLERRGVSSHANVSVTLGGFARELGAAGAVAFSPAPRLTITGEVVGRLMDTPGRIIEAPASHPRLPGVETLRLVPASSTLSIVTLAPGFKWNLADTWVLVGNLTVPLTSGGLTAPLTPFVGLDYSLTR